MASTVFSFLFEKKTPGSLAKKQFYRYNTDTSRVFYYSFSQEKVVDLKAKTQRLKNEKLTVTKGTQVLLESPIFHANALYLWEGPNGFRSYSQNVLLENVHTNQSGIYTVSVKKANGLVSGKIELTVVEKDF
jgi:hypothetical protein